MGKTVFIAEKPSVAVEFAKALKVQTKRGDGYLEGNNTIFTWCVGHLVTMSYPDAYDPALKKWSLETLPFIPEEFKYEVIPGVKKQFEVVKKILTSPEVDTIYVCTDSGREGEYIYRLVEQQIGVKGKKRKRVWIDSQTEDEIRRGIKEAKDLSEYDNLSASAYLRAKEDYLMGINFSRLLTLKYANGITNFLGEEKYTSIAVGRVMTCVLGMVVSREREIRDFVKTPFYRVLGSFQTVNGKTISLKNVVATEGEVKGGLSENGSHSFQGEWRVNPRSKYFESPYLYRENGFKERVKAEELIHLLGGEVSKEIGEEDRGSSDVENLELANTEANSRVLECEGLKERKESGNEGITGEIVSLEKKKEKKNPPLLYNLAELQNGCAKMYKISPDETLRVVQELYEKKLVTYPRTDARVLSSAVAKEISKNLNGLMKYPIAEPFLQEIVSFGTHKGLEKTRYVNDKQITDHYAIIPTGQGFSALSSVSPLGQKVYDTILKRFLSIFYPPAVYQKVTITIMKEIEKTPKRKVKSSQVEDAEVAIQNSNEEKPKVIEAPWEELFYANFKVLAEEGYLKVIGGGYSSEGEKNNQRDGEEQEENRRDKSIKDAKSEEGMSEETNSQQNQLRLFEEVSKLKKGDKLFVTNLQIKEGETTPPKRYNSGSLILTMENAGQFIEDEELRAQIKGSGIGTSATRAEIQKKLINIKYLNLNKKTQIITPTLQGEMVYDVVRHSINSLLNPELTASWEKGLGYVAEGEITTEDYIKKLDTFVRDRTNRVKGLNNQKQLQTCYGDVAKHYKSTKR